MIFIDSSALVAMIADEPDAAALAAKIQVEDARISAGHVIVEASLRLATVLGLAPTAADSLVTNLLREAGVVIVPSTEEVAHAAVAAFERYGQGRGKTRLNFGDCVTYACARLHGARLLFKGEDFAQTDVVRA